MKERERLREWRGAESEKKGVCVHICARVCAHTVQAVARWSWVDALRQRCLRYTPKYSLLQIQETHTHTQTNVTTRTSISTLKYSHFYEMLSTCTALRPCDSNCSAEVGAHAELRKHRGQESKGRIKTGVKSKRE